MNITSLSIVALTAAFSLVCASPQTPMPCSPTQSSSTSSSLQQNSSTQSAPTQSPQPQGSPAQSSPTPKDTKTSRITLSLPEKLISSEINFKTELLPGELFQLVTAEAVLERTRMDFGVFATKLTKDDWKVAGETYSYAWKSPDCLALSFSARPEGDAIVLEYTLENGTPTALERLQIHPCLPTQGSAAFFPGTVEQAVLGSGGRAARAGKHDYTELWSRLFLWTDGRKWPFAKSALAKEEKHLSFGKKNEEATDWSWWKNGIETFDLPLIAAESKDGKHVLALAFEKSIWASSNGGDPRACIHLFPYFGRLKPGEKSTVRGRLYVLEGGADMALERFKKDFPKLVKG